MKRPLMGMGIALVAGMAAGWSKFPFMFLIAAFLLIILYCQLKTENSTKYIVGFSVLLFVGFCRVVMDDYGTAVQMASVHGTIKKIEEKEKCQYITLETEDRVRILAIIKKSDEGIYRWYKGQKIKIEGEAESFEPASNPGSFDEKLYYRGQGIEYKIWVESVQLLSEGDFLSIKLRWIEDLRRKISCFFDRSLNVEEAAVLKAAVIGERSDFKGELKRYYQENGWIHLVTVSGLHLSFIAMRLYKWLRKKSLPLIPALLLGILSMGFYGYMTDMGDSVLRAMGMMLFQFSGDLFGRKPDRLTSLVSTGAVLLMMRPGRLQSVGFQLSFGAVLGVEYGRWLYKKWYMKDNRKETYWRKTFFIQFGIFLTGLPVLLWNMYEISAFGFIYNFFMIPLMSFIVPYSFIAGLLGTSALPVLRWAGGIFLFFVQGVLSLIHCLPARTILCGRPEFWQIIFYVILIVLASLGLSLEKKYRSAVFTVTACLTLLFFRMPEDRIICMDVGQGDGICLLTEEGRMFLIDGGSTDRKEVWTYQIQPLMKFYGIRKIDRWFLTHGDRDHVSGVEEAIESGDADIGCLMFPDCSGDEVLDQIKAEAVQSGIRVDTFVPGSCVHSGNIRLTCLYPSKNHCCRDKNNNSLVLMYERTESKEKFRMLLVGDLEMEGEKILLSDHIDVRCDVLKVGHHGSSGASSETFLKAVQGKWAVISCGKDNKYGHPHIQTLERLQENGYEWTSTSIRGAVFVEFSSKGYTIRCQKKRIEMRDGR